MVALGIHRISIWRRVSYRKILSFFLSKMCYPKTAICGSFMGILQTVSQKMAPGIHDRLCAPLIKTNITSSLTDEVK